MLDITIKKGKGYVLGKLRTMQLIEANIQLLIRIFINQRNKFKIKKDSRVTKYNYGYAILEKRIIYDNSLLNRKMTMHNMMDLKSYYDRHLVEIGSIIQELVGVKRLKIKSFSKLILVIEYHICTSYGTSTEFYRGLQEK